MGNMVACLDGPSEAASGGAVKRATKRAPTIELPSYSIISVDKEKPDALAGEKWAQVRPSLDKAQIPYRVLMLNDKAFGITQGNAKVGTFLICLSNTDGIAIVDSIVKA